MLRSTLIFGTVMLITALAIAVLTLGICLYETNKMLEWQRRRNRGVVDTYMEYQRENQRIERDTEKRVMDWHWREVQKIETRGFGHRVGIDEQTKQW